MKHSASSDRSLKSLLERLDTIANDEYAAVSRSFFKTGPGEYSEDDVFRGIRVPQLRKVARQYADLGYRDLQKLIRSKYHEDRLLALLILLLKYRKTDETEQDRIYGFYVRNMKSVNNWDLVDLSAEHIIGAWLWERAKRPLTDWAKSNNLWERRIAIVSTFHFIRKNEFAETLRIARILLRDEEDLIHKAVGWMLREVGKRDVAVLEEFLQKHYRRMPRTMLRYAIERFPEPKRQAYLKSEIPISE
jgi:3-methyladenine DNA glycosylase AlkD